MEAAPLFLAAARRELSNRLEKVTGSTSTARLSLFSWVDNNYVAFLLNSITSTSSMTPPVTWWSGEALIVQPVVVSWPN